MTNPSLAEEDRRGTAALLEGDAMSAGSPTQANAASVRARGVPLQSRVVGANSLGLQRIMTLIGSPDKDVIGMEHCSVKRGAYTVRP